MAAELNGHCDPRFLRVHDVLATHIRSGKEVGASLCVTIDGEPVIDLWGGWRDRERLHPWTADTLVNVFSATKTVASLAVLMLHERGQLDLFAPVASYWPEFAQAGKARVEVRHLLAHTAGLPAWEPPFSLAEALDIETSTARLAAQAPWWEPGTRGSYHASSFGHLVGELVRRVTGQSLGRFIASEIAGPLRADIFLGLQEAQMDRVATVYPPPDGEKSAVAAARAAAAADDPLAVERAIQARTKAGSFSGQKRDPLALFNSREWRRAELAGSSGHANGRGLAQAMTVLANGGVACGVTLLSPETIALVFHEQFKGTDGYYLKPIRWGIGYALAPLEYRERGPLPFLRPGRRTCYWYGSGGALALADAERRIAIGYAMNQCQNGRNMPNGTYYDAFYDCL